VGVSISALRRLCSHCRSKWFNRISTVKIETHSSKAAALKAERQAIRSESPMFNITGTPKARRKKMAAPRFYVGARIPTHVRKGIAERAAIERRSISTVIAMCLEKAVANE